MVDAATNAGKGSGGLDMKRGLISLYVLLFSPEPTLASDISTQHKPAYETLKSASFFATDRVDIRGDILETVIALDTLLQQKNATATFSALLKEVTPTGQLYALLGLKIIDENLFAKEAAPYLTSKEWARQVQGCRSVERTVGTLARRIQEGEIRVH